MWERNHYSKYTKNACEIHLFLCIIVYLSHGIISDIPWAIYHGQYYIGKFGYKVNNLYKFFKVYDKTVIARASRWMIKQLLDAATSDIEIYSVSPSYYPTRLRLVG